MQQSITSRVWVIIPAYNEQKYIARVLERVLKVTSNIILVDDGSKDLTFKIASEQIPQVLRHQINLGKGAALKTGAEYAFSELQATGIIFFDGDDQHDPNLLRTFATGLQTSEVVLGVRAFDNKMPLLRIMMNRLASFLVLLFFGKYIPDIPCGFKALSESAYKKINWKSRDYAVEMEIAARVAQYDLKFSEVSIPTVYHDLDRGMTILDTISIVPQFISWRFFP
jgi:glycosyltransferase involved in cell wall biosynthesis